MNDETKMIIWNDGKVGIGTQCIPLEAKLAVKGKIISEELNIRLADANNCWPDFVFENGYFLLSLEELESYILQIIIYPKYLKKKKFKKRK